MKSWNVSSHHRKHQFSSEWSVNVFTYLFCSVESLLVGEMLQITQYLCCVPWTLSSSFSCTDEPGMDSALQMWPNSGGRSPAGRILPEHPSTP